MVNGGRQRHHAFWMIVTGAGGTQRCRRATVRGSNPPPRHAHHAFNQIGALEAAIVAVAAAMADTSRVRMLSALMDGRAWTATG
jgi:hypothetical protein